MKNCTTTAITGAIFKLTSVRSSLRVKRKDKALRNNKSAWWFVIHGQEADLNALETQWEKVQLQTGWSLQPCYMSKDLSTATEAHNMSLSGTSNTMTNPPPQGTTIIMTDTLSTVDSGENHLSNNLSNSATSNSFLEVTHPSLPSQ